jgi:Tfp pilus assembly protein PilP
VKTGDYIGRGKARVVAIENDQVGIEEWIRVGHGMVKKLMTLHL